MKNRIKLLREARGWNLDELAARLDTYNQQISRIELGKTKLTAEWMEKLAAVFEVPITELLPRASDLLEDGERLPKRTQTDSEAVEQRGIPEIDVRAGMGGGGAEALVQSTWNGWDSQLEETVVARWDLPPEFVRHELATNPASLTVVPAVGDSMEPTIQSRERVIVDLADRSPSPPGIFAMWDGFGLVLKRLQLIPNSDPPSIEILSDNDRYPAYQRTVDEVHLIGRVVGSIRRL